MQNQLITIEAYCEHHHTEPSFIEALEKGGLLTITIVEESRFIDYDQLPRLGCYSRWFYDMDINVAGIDAINNLLEKVNLMQQEIQYLKQQLSVYQISSASL